MLQGSVLQLGKHAMLWQGSLGKTPNTEITVNYFKAGCSSFLLPPSVTDGFILLPFKPLPTIHFPPQIQFTSTFLISISTSTFLISTKLFTFSHSSYIHSHLQYSNKPNQQNQIQNLDGCTHLRGNEFTLMKMRIFI